MQLNKVHKAACHCKSVEFEVDLPNGLDRPRRCDCSFCRMRGAIAASAPLNGLRITKGQEKLTLYQFNTKTAKHYFLAWRRYND